MKNIFSIWWHCLINNPQHHQAQYLETVFAPNKPEMVGKGWWECSCGYKNPLI